MKLIRGALCGLAALLILAMAGSVLASKPVHWRNQPWEDLVGYAGSVKKGDFRIYVIKDFRKPCAPGKNKYNVNAKKLTGRSAMNWLIKKGLAKYDSKTGKLHKTQTLKDWAFSKKAYQSNPNRGLYWQRACMGTQLKSGCGDRYTDDQRRHLIRTVLNPKKKAWDRTRVRTYAVYGGLKADMINPNYGYRHYQANVQIWKKKVNCVHQCVMATPRDFQVNTAAQKIYRACLARCNKISWKKCP